VSILSPKEFVEKYAIKSLVACFSGGKDSLVATHYVMTETEGMDLERYVIWVDTGIMIPPAQEFVESVCKRFGWNLVILKPKLSFEEFCLRYGAPSLKRRWCCYHLKLEPLFRFKRELAIKGKIPIGSVLGLRREESRKRRGIAQVLMETRRAVKWVWNYCPIVDWGAKQGLDYIRANDLPMPPWYKLGIRETCQCGAFSHVPELLRLRAQYPELFRRFVEIERQFKKDSSFFFDRGRRVFTREIAAQKTLEEVAAE